jgi:DNA-binding PadR family transcriptional regulator
VANFWTASRQQIYQELSRLAEQRLVRARDVVQQSRPNKRLFSVTEAGLRELEHFVRQPTRPTSIRDELLVKVQVADFGNRMAVAEALDRRRAEAEERLAVFESLLREYRDGRSESAYLHSAARLGPYLNLKRGRDFEAENIAWYRWAASVLRRRGDEESDGSVVDEPDG